MKIVLDTNVILSATVFGGMGEIIIDLIFKNKLEFFISLALKEEVLKKLKEFNSERAIISKTLAVLEKGTFVTTGISITVCRDPKDNFLLELAQTTEADFFITRDLDLLDLPNKTWKRTKIVKPEEFLRDIRSKKLLNN